MNYILENRVAQLEKNLRIYRIFFIALVIVAGSFATMSFRNNKSNAPEVVQAKKFQVVDDRGNVLVELNKEYGNGQISTFTPDGHRLVSLFTSEGGTGGINTYSKDGKVLFKVTNTTDGGGYMALFNSRNTEIAELGTTNNESGYFRINNNQGEKLAWITYTQGGGGYFSLSNNGTEMFRFSTPDAGGRLGVYNGYDKRIAYIGAQDNRDGNITIWNSSGARTGGLP